MIEVSTGNVIWGILCIIFFIVALISIYFTIVERKVKYILVTILLIFLTIFSYKKANYIDRSNIYQCTYSIYYPNKIVTKSIKSNINDFYLTSDRGTNILKVQHTSIEKTSAPIEIINIIKIK